MLVPAPSPRLARGTAVLLLMVMRGSPPLSGVLVASTKPGMGLPPGSVKMLAGLILMACGPKSVTLRAEPMRATFNQVARLNVSSITADGEPGRLVMDPLNGAVVCCNASVFPLNQA